MITYHDVQGERGRGVGAISTARDGRCCCDRGDHWPQKHKQQARAHMMSQGAGEYRCAAHSRRREGRCGRKKMGISAAAGTVNQTCIFIGSDLDGPIGSDLDGKGSRTARV